MLDKNVFKSGIVKLKTFYVNWNIDTESSEVMKAWYEEFKGCQANKFKSMVDGYIRNETYNPSVKGLYDYYRQSNIPDAEETRKEIREKAKRLGW